MHIEEEYRDFLMHAFQHYEGYIKNDLDNKYFADAFYSIHYKLMNCSFIILNESEITLSFLIVDEVSKSIIDKNEDFNISEKIFLKHSSEYIKNYMGSSLDEIKERWITLIRN